MKFTYLFLFALAVNVFNTQTSVAQAIDYGSPEETQRSYLHSSHYIDIDNDIYQRSLDKIMDELALMNPGKRKFSDADISWAIMSYVRMKAVYSSGDDRVGSQILETIFTVNSIDEQIQAGDCDELAFAAAGLHRVAGIHARIIGGGLKRMNKDTGHAWLQVWVDGRWINIELARMAVKGWYRRNLQEGSSFLFKRSTENTGYEVSPEDYLFRTVYSF